MWPDALSGSFPPATRAARLVRLGSDASHAITTSLRGVYGSEVSTLLGNMLGLVPETGAAPALLLRAALDALRARERRLAHARAAAAGARASARMIAALPLAGLVLLPGQFGRLLEPGGRAGVVLGLGLCWAGVTWIDRLVPDASPMPRWEMVPRLMGAAFRAGCDVHQALAPVSVACLEEPAARHVVRAVRLGMPAPAALVRAEPSLARVAEILERSTLTGQPAAEQLDELARANDDARAAAFESSLKRAPVAMVLPLGICVLPSFVLLCVVPLLRGVRVAG